jgi:biopolymer transport protein ExbB/TolQ
MMPFTIPVWAWKLIGLALITAALWFAWNRLTSWHAAYEELPEVKKTLESELACEKGSECDKRSEERANKAAADAAQAASTAVAAAMAAEEATRREAAAWRDRFREAKQNSAPCATWAAQPVECPL